MKSKLCIVLIIVSLLLVGCGGNALVKQTVSQGIVKGYFQSNSEFQFPPQINLCKVNRSEDDVKFNTEDIKWNIENTGLDRNAGFLLTGSVQATGFDCELTSWSTKVVTGSGSISPEEKYPFIMSDIPSGKYSVVLLVEVGTAISDLRPVLWQNDSGAPIIFDLPSDQGIDLGIIIANYNGDVFETSQGGE